MDIAARVPRIPTHVGDENDFDDSPLPRVPLAMVDGPTARVSQNIFDALSPPKALPPTPKIARALLEQDDYGVVEDARSSTDGQAGGLMQGWEQQFRMPIRAPVTADEGDESDGEEDAESDSGASYDTALERMAASSAISSQYGSPRGTPPGSIYGGSEAGDSIRRRLSEVLVDEAPTSSFPLDGGNEARFRGASTYGDSQDQQADLMPVAKVTSDDGGQQLGSGYIYDDDDDDDFDVLDEPAVQSAAGLHVLGVGYEDSGSAQKTTRVTIAPAEELDYTAKRDGGLVAAPANEHLTVSAAITAGGLPVVGAETFRPTVSLDRLEERTTSVSGGGIRVSDAPDEPTAGGLPVAAVPDELLLQANEVAELTAGGLRIAGAEDVLPAAGFSVAGDGDKASALLSAQGLPVAGHEPTAEGLPVAGIEPTAQGLPVAGAVASVPSGVEEDLSARRLADPAQENYLSPKPKGLPVAETADVLALPAGTNADQAADEFIPAKLAWIEPTAQGLPVAGGEELDAAGGEERLPIKAQGLPELARDDDVSSAAQRLPVAGSGDIALPVDIDAEEAGQGFTPGKPAETETTARGLAVPGAEELASAEREDDVSVVAQRIAELARHDYASPTAQRLPVAETEYSNTTVLVERDAEQAAEGLEVEGAEQGKVVPSSVEERPSAKAEEVAPAGDIDATRAASVPEAANLASEDNAQPENGELLRAVGEDLAGAHYGDSTSTPVEDQNLVSAVEEDAEALSVRGDSEVRSEHSVAVAPKGSAQPTAEGLPIPAAEDVVVKAGTFSAATLLPVGADEHPTIQEKGVPILAPQPPFDGSDDVPARDNDGVPLTAQGLPVKDAPVHNEDAPLIFQVLPVAGVQELVAAKQEDPAQGLPVAGAETSVAPPIPQEFPPVVGAEKAASAGFTVVPHTAQGLPVVGAEEFDVPRKNNEVLTVGGLPVPAVESVTNSEGLQGLVPSHDEDVPLISQVLPVAGAQEVVAAKQEDTAQGLPVAGAEAYVALPIAGELPPVVGAEKAGLERYIDVPHTAQGLPVAGAEEFDVPRKNDEVLTVEGIPVPAVKSVSSSEGLEGFVPSHDKDVPLISQVLPVNGAQEVVAAKQEDTAQGLPVAGAKTYVALPSAEELPVVGAENVFAAGSTDVTHTAQGVPVVRAEQFDTAQKNEVSTVEAAAIEGGKEQVTDIQARSAEVHGEERNDESILGRLYVREESVTSTAGSGLASDQAPLYTAEGAGEAGARLPEKLDEKPDFLGQYQRHRITNSEIVDGQDGEGDSSVVPAPNPGLTSNATNTGDGTRSGQGKHRNLAELLHSEEEESATGTGLAYTTGEGIVPKQQSTFQLRRVKILGILQSFSKAANAKTARFAKRTIKILFLPSISCFSRKKLAVAQRDEDRGSSSAAVPGT